MLQNQAKIDLITKQKVSGKKVKRNIGLLYLINIFSSIHFFGGVMIPFFEDYGGLDFAEIMILESIFMGGIFLMEIPTGTIADKYSRKLSLNLAYFINIIAIWVYVLVPNFWMFALGEIIWAIAAALHSGTYDAILYDTLVELGEETESKKHFSRLKSIGLIAMPLGSLSGAFIASEFGLKATMTFSMIPLGIAMVSSFWLVEPAVHNISHEESVWKIFKNGLSKIRKSKSLQRIISDMVILSSIGYFGIWLYQKRLRMIGLEIKYFGMVQTGIIIFEIIFLNLAIYLEKLMKSKKKVLTLAGMGIGIGFLITSIFSSITMNIIGFIVAAGFGMTYQVLSINYMNKHIPSAQRATILSTASMFRKCVVMVANPVIGYGVEWNIGIILFSLSILAGAWAILSPVRESDLID